MKLSTADIELIMHTVLFHGTAESVLVKMSSGTDCNMRIYDKGEVIYSRKNFSRSIGIILEGSVRVFKESADGHSIIINTLTSGDIFGAAALYNDEKEYVTELIALEHCRVIFFSQRLISRGIERDHRLAENYIRYLSGRILFLNRKLYFLTAGTAEQRLANFIADNISETDFTELPLSMTQLAAELNISRASLYRAMTELEHLGAVEKENKKIRIADKNKLKEMIA